MLSYIFTGREALSSGTDRVSQIIQKCAVLDLKLRYQTVLELITDVEKLEVTPTDAPARSVQGWAVPPVQEPVLNRMRTPLSLDGSTALLSRSNAPASSAFTGRFCAWILSRATCSRRSVVAHW